MNIQDIKNEFGFSVLSMVRQFDQNGVQQEWLSHWDNERRIRVAMHENVFEQIKANPALNCLDYNYQIVEAKGNRKEYVRIVVIISQRPRGYYEIEGNNRDLSYEKYNGAFGYDDDAIDNAFEGDPSNCWNVD